MPCNMPPCPKPSTKSGRADTISMKLINAEMATIIDGISGASNDGRINRFARRLATTEANTMPKIPCEALITRSKCCGQPSPHRNVIVSR